MSAASFLGAINAAQINNPVPPVDYSTWVWVVGLVLLALIGAWLWFVLYNTRKRPAGSESGGRDRYATLRTSLLSQIDSAEERYRDGESDLRNLHLDLNHIMRAFANGRMRTDTSSLTVREIARLEGTDRLVGLLSDYEEPAFAADTDAEALSATESARAVVREW